jgi:hypothetical protein
MDIITKLKDAYAFLGDPLHREAWEEIERLREKEKEFDQIAYVIDSHGITHEEFTIIFKDEE